MKSRKNKMLEIYDFLKQAIDSGKYKTGELLPTDMQIADKFGTSRPTVARAVQKLKDEGLIGRKAGYGTYVSQKAHANNINEDAEQTFGLLIPALGETEIFEPICGQIANLADEFNFNLVWGGGGTVGNRDANIAETLAQKYISQRVNGVFFTPLELVEDAFEKNQHVLNLLSKAGIPVVLLDNDFAKPPQRSDYDLIGIDNIEAGFVMCNHLIEKGCRNIAFVTKPNVANTVQLRIMGALEAVKQAGSSVSLTIHSVESEMTDLAQNFKKNKKLDGIICYNDAAAANLIVELDEIGIDIPGELKVCAFDDVKYAKLIRTPLTTYHQPCREIGTAAVDTMLSRVRNPDDSARRVLLKGELIVRKSTK